VVDLSGGLEPLYEFAREHPAGCFAGVTEIGLLIPSRMWDSITTFGYLAQVAQTRRHRMHFRWDSQFLDMVDKNIRANTQLCWECQVIFRHPWRRDEGAVTDLESGHKPQRPLLMRAYAFRPKHVDLSASSKKDKVLGRKWALFDMKVAQAYDTFHMIAAANRDQGYEIRGHHGAVAPPVSVDDADLMLPPANGRSRR
jgi:hypothetical protein